MLVTERKRVIYDQDGSLCEIQQVRSIRKTQSSSPRNMIQSEHDNSKPSHQTNKKINYITNILLLAIVIAFLIILDTGIFNIYFSQHHTKQTCPPVHNNKQGFKKLTDSFDNIALEKLNKTYQEAQQLKAYFLKNSQCKLIYNRLHCFLDLPQQGSEDCAQQH